MRRLLLVGILALAFLLRFVGLANHPVGFTPDEASFGYDAYSILHTGRDQWGHFLPLTLRSFGDYKLPLYGYLTIPSVAAFGLNEFAVRLPNVVVGTLAVLATYLLVKKLFLDTKNLSPITRHSSLPLLAAFMLAISPWHLPLSRGAFEANLTTFFLPFGVWCFLKGGERPAWMVGAALSLGLNLFTYHSARLVTPIIVLVLIVLHWQQAKNWKKYSVAAAVFALFLFVSFWTMFTGAGGRGADVAIFNPTGGWSAVADSRFEADRNGLPDFLSRIFSNKLTYTTNEFIKSYLSYLSPQFLFTQGAGEWTYGMVAGHGVLYLVELPFLIFGVWKIARSRLTRSDPVTLIIIWILLAPIPAALAKGPGFAANRAAIMMPALQIFSAFGAIVLWDVVRKKWPRRKNILLSCYLVALLLCFSFFLESYIYHTKDQAKGMLYGRKQAAEFIQSNGQNYPQIVMSRSLSEPQIYVAFYTKWDPEDYQKSTSDWLRYKSEGHSFVDQLGEYHLGKYVFSSLDYQKYSKSLVLFVAKPGEVPKEGKIIKTINYPESTPAIILAEPSNPKGN